MKPYKDMKDEIRKNRDARLEEKLRVLMVQVESELNIAIGYGYRVCDLHFRTSKYPEIPKRISKHLRKLGYIVRLSSDRMNIYLLENTFKNKFLSFLHFYFGLGVI